MKKILLLVVLAFSIYAQSQVFEAGMNVTKKELSTNIYQKEPDASAVVIYDYGNSFFDKRTWRLNVEIKQKIKILTKDGLDYGKREIPLYVGKNPKETIEDISARVYNVVNGETVVSNLSKDAIFTEKNENYDVVRLVFPNVKVGSIITYSYTKTTTYINKFQPWYFQQEIPVVYSEYNASIPGNYEYNIKLVGSLPLDVNTSDVENQCLEASRGAYANCAVYKYVMTNIPAYKSEKYTTSETDHLSRIEYELSVIRHFDGEVNKISKSWQDVDDELKTDSDFGRQINKTRLVKDIVPSHISSIPDDLEKAKAIYQFVLDNYKWNNESGRYDASVKRLIEENGGNAFEINLLLQNLLYSEGFEAYPMLISTRDNGIATKIYPVLTEFNYVIVKLNVGDKTYYLDGTNSYLSFGELPLYCLNQYGRVYDIEYASYWEDIEQNYSTTQIGAKYKLDDNNQLVGNVTIGVTGNNAYSKKKLHAENPTLYLENLKSQYQNSTIESHKVLSKEKNAVRFLEELEITQDDVMVADKIYFNPFIYKFYNENPFKLERRTHPVDFGYKQAFSYLLELELTDKLKILELPEPTTLALPNKAGLVTFTCTSNNDKLSVFVRIKLDKPFYNIDYYEALKTFMSKIIDLQNNTVVVLEKQ